MARTFDRRTVVSDIVSRAEKEKTFADIDAKAFQRARRDPIVRQFAAEADSHLKRLRDEGRID